MRCLFFEKKYCKHILSGLELTGAIGAQLSISNLLFLIHNNKIVRLAVVGMV